MSSAEKILSPRMLKLYSTLPHDDDDDAAAECGTQTEQRFIRVYSKYCQIVRISAILHVNRRISGYERPRLDNSTRLDSTPTKRVPLSQPKDNTVYS
ncbi:hypothetical protein ACLKA7_008487 [Drosophila subpalustris]